MCTDGACSNSAREIDIAIRNATDTGVEDGGAVRSRPCLKYELAQDRPLVGRGRYWDRLCYFPYASFHHNACEFVALPDEVRIRCIGRYLGSFGAFMLK